jgi:hypothetical protein
VKWDSQESGTLRYCSHPDLHVPIGDGGEGVGEGVVAFCIEGDTEISGNSVHDVGQCRVEKSRNPRQCRS